MTKLLLPTRRWPSCRRRASLTRPVTRCGWSI